MRNFARIDGLRLVGLGVVFGLGALLAPAPTHAQQAQRLDALDCGSDDLAAVAERIIDAFDEHQFVLIGSTHGGIKRHELLLCLLSRPSFQATATDILVEFVSGAHQALLDRYLIELENLAPDELRPLALDTDYPQLLATLPQVPGFLRAVRSVNERRARSERIRVLGGSETIQWTRVETREDLAPFPFKTNWSAHLIVEHLAPEADRRALVVYGDGGHIQHGGTLTGDVEATLDPALLFVVGAIASLEEGERDRVAAFGDPDKPFYLENRHFPDVERLPSDLAHMSLNELGRKIDALVYLGPVPDVNLMGAMPFTEQELQELERRRRIRGGRSVLEIRFGGRDRWFAAHPFDIPPDPRRSGSPGG